MKGGRRESRSINHRQLSVTAAAAATQHSRAAGRALHGCPYRPRRTGPGTCDVAAAATRARGRRTRRKRRTRRTRRRSTLLATLVAGAKGLRAAFLNFLRPIFFDSFSLTQVYQHNVHQKSVSEIRIARPLDVNGLSTQVWVTIYWALEAKLRCTEIFFSAGVCTCSVGAAFFFSSSARAMYIMETPLPTATPAPAREVRPSRERTSPVVLTADISGRRC